MHPVIWPGFLDPAAPLFLSGPPTLTRLVVADVLWRLTTDQCMPGVPPHVLTAPAEVLILSADPKAMETALRRYGVISVRVEPLPRTSARRWEAIADVMAGADLIVLDGVDAITTSADRETAVLYARCVMGRRQSLWITQGAGTERRTIPTPPCADARVSGVALDESGRVCLGLLPTVGRRNPPPLIGSITRTGRIAWEDPVVVHRRERLAAMAW